MWTAGLRGARRMEALHKMAISEKETKLLMNFVKDGLKEVRNNEDVEKKIIL